MDSAKSLIVDRTHPVLERAELQKKKLEAPPVNQYRVLSIWGRGSGLVPCLGDAIVVVEAKMKRNRFSPTSTTFDFSSFLSFVALMD